MGTRTLSAVGGFNLVLLVLLGGCGSSDAPSIESVLQADSTTTTGATSVADVVNRMRAIDLSKCPKDFAAAYVAHIHAWELLADVEQQGRAYDANFNSGGAMVESFLRGFIGDPFGKTNESIAARNQLVTNYNSAQQQIKQTFQRVEELAVSHGAKMPKRG